MAGLDYGFAQGGFDPAPVIIITVCGDRQRASWPASRRRSRQLSAALGPMFAPLTPTSTAGVWAACTQAPPGPFRCSYFRPRV